ncbi:MAG: hypothetical protein RR922_01785 [Clostridia bacterium]
MKSELEILKLKIEENDIISFDIFDTLVFRNVMKPKDIFKIVEETFIDHDIIKGFAKFRAESEAKARLLSGKEDIELDEIYDFMDDKYKGYTEKIKQYELDIEKEFIVENKFMKKAFNYAKKLNKKILIISDMYLPNSFLQLVLEKEGYKGFDNLYVSGSLNKTKATGSIYEFVRSENKIRMSDKWLHIGDNTRSDIENAKSKGINVFYYKPPAERIKYNYKMNLKESIMNAIQINTSRNGIEISTFEKMGIEDVSSIFYGFCDWLASVTSTQDNLMFLSRDGYFPQKVYELFKEKRKIDVYTKYLLTSRKAYQIPAYALMEKKDVIEQLTLWNSQLDHKITIKDIYKQVGLDASSFIREIKTLGFKDENTVLDFMNRDKIKKLLALTYSKIKKKLELRLELVKEYLIQEGVDKFEQLNIVDIGWRGSIHNAMQKILSNDINGFYFGTTEHVYDAIRLNTFGYYFDLGFPIENKQFGLDNVMMFELIFNSPEQSLNSFAEENGKIVPVYSTKKNTYGKDLNTMQNAALETIKEYIKYDKYLTGITCKSSMRNYINFIIDRNYEDRAAFKNFTNEIGMDDGEYGYVLEVSKETFLKDYKKVLEKAKFSLWQDTFVIKGINTKEEYDKFLKENNIKIKRKNKAIYHFADYIYMATKFPSKVLHRSGNAVKALMISKAEKNNKCGE